MGACHSQNEVRIKNKKNFSEGEKIYLQCKSCREKLSNYIKALETKEKNSREKAKDLLRKKQRDRAKLYLKQCKKYKEQIKIAEGKLDMMDDQIINIENLYNTKDVMKAIKQGNETLQKVQKDINIEDLEKIKDDLEDLKEKDKEVGEFFKDKVNEDEADCEEELNNLEKEMQNNNKNVNDKNKSENINTKNNVNLPNLPSVPNTKITDNRVQIQQNYAQNKKQIISN